MIKETLMATLKKFNPRYLIKNPVVFLVYICSVITTIILVVSFFHEIAENRNFLIGITVFLWFTILFANFAESLAESKGKAGAEYLKKSKQEIIATVLEEADLKAKQKKVSSSVLEKGDIVLVKAGEQIPLDGEVIKGIASVDESVITGESAPVIREAGGDRDGVTGGTTVLSDWLMIKITVANRRKFFR